MKKFGLPILVVSLFILFTFTPGVRSIAQDAQPIKIGEITLGQLTKAAPQVKFSFSGKKDEVYVVSFSATEKGTLFADLSVLGSDGKALRRYNMVGEAILVQLPADGDFTLNVKGMGSAEGPFAVQLYRLSKLEKGQPVETAINFRLLVDGGKLVATNAYYLIESPTDFKLTIKLGEQKFPKATVGIIGYYLSRIRTDNLGVLEPLYTGSGDKFIALTVSFKGAPELHILSLNFSGFSST